LAFFKGRSKDKPSFSFLEADIHSHVLNGIDDGAKSAEESIEILTGLRKLGFKRFVTTPHIMREYYPNTVKSITGAHSNLGIALKNANESFTLKAAAEYYGDEYLLQLLDQDQELLTIADNYVLFEVSMLAESPLINSIIFKLNTKGYQPILAHPERYLYYKTKLDVFGAFDCDLQVNLLSLSGYYGPEQKKLGVYLIENDLVKFLGTDIHRSAQLKYLQKLLKDKKMMKLLESKIFKNSSLEIRLF
jgi:tyrosine-protein phosphatase YwqE